MKKIAFMQQQHNSGRNVYHTNDKNASKANTDDKISSSKSGATRFPSSKVYNLLTDIRDIWDSRILNALPDQWRGQATAAIIANDVDVLYQNQSIRDIEYLQQHGRCIDHIVPTNRPSTIDGAGHGAFAKRNLPKGTIITGTPLHHIPDQSIFFMYDSEIKDANNNYSDDQFGDDTNNDGETLQEEIYVRTNQVIGKQLVVNYCFGHPESTLLLCPYGSGINYINHNRTLANVKVQWSTDGTMGHNDEWIKSRTINDMFQDLKSHLAFDYIAIRDIQEGWMVL